MIPLENKTKFFLTVQGLKKDAHLSDIILMENIESSFLRYCRDIMDTMNLRLYRVLGVTACLSNTLGFVANVIAHGWSWASVFFGINALIMYIAFYVGERYGKKTETTLIMIILTTLVEFPVICYLYGASRAVFCIFAALVYVIFLGRPIRFVFLGAALFLNCGAFVLREVWPSYIAEETSRGAFFTMILSLIIVMLVTFALLGVIRNFLDIQQESILDIGGKLEDVLIHDALTGAYNRQYMYETFESLREKNDDIICALIDIDDFKQINDALGHVFGDDVLVTLANILMEKAGDSGRVFRFGGEEFLILFADGETDDILGLLSEANEAFFRHFSESDDITITFSGGVVKCEKDDDLESALKIADARLYNAKNSGKNRLVSKGFRLPEAPKRFNRMQ